MSANDHLDDIDWSLTSWEGSRREQLKRWSELTFDEILNAQEAMAELAELHGSTSDIANSPSQVSEPESPIQTSPVMHTIPLPGCTPEPLMGYLKALGVFRIVSEQADPTCRARWQGGCLVLDTKLSREELTAYFIERYAPSPNFSPWNGRGGFLTESGTSFSTIESIRSSTNPRLKPLQEAISQIEKMGILKDFGQARAEAKELDKKKKAKRASAEELERLKERTKQVKSLKETILYQIRTEFPDNALGWFDTCLQVGEDGFSVAPALGSGGVDGSMDFSSNFFSNIILILEHPESSAWIESSLFAEGVATLHNASIGQFSPGNIGGPNATQGFEGASMLNPWDFILLIEGTSLLAGAITRRCRTAQFGKAAFPFTVMPTAQDGDSVDYKDGNTARGEVWLPLWEKPLKLSELERIFGEGRAEWSGCQSRTNVDFAKAIASYGVDRGIRSFSRHGFLQRNGTNFLATPLGRFEVRSRENIHLLREADDWIGRFRRACGDKAPARFRRALRRLDSAIFDYCRFGGVDRFQGILIALGQAEREVATGQKFRLEARLSPLKMLSGDWVSAADDHSPEFEIAVALAGIYGSSGKLPGLRSHMEPVAYGKKGLDWDETSRACVWTRGDFCSNLTASLERRMLDARRLNLDAPPLTSSRTVKPRTVAAFIAGAIDNEKIENLLWGLIGCRAIPYASVRRTSFENNKEEAFFPLPQSYPLLKATLTGLHKDSSYKKSFSAEQAATFDKLKHVKADARLLQLLRAGRLPEATAMAARRLRNADLTPADIDWAQENLGDTASSQRLAAALLLPVSDWQLTRLLLDVLRKEVRTDQTV